MVFSFGLGSVGLESSAQVALLKAAGAARSRLSEVKPLASGLVTIGQGLDDADNNAGHEVAA
jgi:hypothetical protein